ncbi:hypothetical protein, partial [Bradyrhizobium sp.]|uniref:hypothetical protein n=1 Tax=Bradyrhizobium sp. TaxID=376 RepID=UPI00263952D8
MYSNLFHFLPFRMVNPAAPRKVSFLVLPVLLASSLQPAFAAKPGGNSLDTSFGDGGLIIGTGGAGNAIALQSLTGGNTGDPYKIVAAGWNCSGTNLLTDYNCLFVVTRFNSDGSLDTTFGDNGQITIKFSPGFYNNQ